MATLNTKMRVIHSPYAANEILDPSKAEDLEILATHLARPSAVLDLANRGHATMVIELLKAMTPATRTAVLSASHAPWGLAINGQAAAVIELVKAMKPMDQVAVLSATYAMWGLAKNGQAETLKELLKAMSPADQATILSAPYAARALTDYGDEGAWTDLVKAMKAAARSLHKVVRGLKHGGKAEAVENVKRAAAPQVPNSRRASATNLLRKDI
jgi:hypothetical protein